MLPPLGSHGDQPDSFQDRQMLGRLRLTVSELFRDLVDRLFPVDQQCQDSPSLRFRNGVEDIRGRRQSGHANIVFQYWNMSIREISTLLVKVGVGLPEELGGFAVLKTLAKPMAKS